MMITQEFPVVLNTDMMDNGEQFVMMLSTTIIMELKLLAANWVFHGKMLATNLLRQLMTVLQLGWIKLNAKVGKEVSSIAEETLLEMKIAATTKMLVLSVKVEEVAQVVQVVKQNNSSMTTSDLPCTVNVLMDTCATETISAALMSTCLISSLEKTRASADALTNSLLMSTSRSKSVISQL